MKKNYRMTMPMDALTKNLFIYNGEIAHECFNLPGQYLGYFVNEIPSSDGELPRIDVGYLTMQKVMTIMNVEDETSHVNVKTLEKLDGYRTNMKAKTKLPVISVIITDLPPKDCLHELWVSKTDLIRPIIISFYNENAEEILNTIIDKINDDEILDDVEAMRLVVILRSFNKNQAKILKTVCNAFKKLKVEDPEYKMELTFCMKCIIHKYAETIDEIKRLEKVIGLNNAIETKSVLRRQMYNEGYSKGHDKGHDEGRLEILNELANDQNNAYTLDYLAGKFGYSKNQILNGK